MEENRVNNRNSGFTIKEYLTIFLKNKKLIIFSSSIAFVFAIILYFFIFTPVYYSTTTIKTTSKIGGVADLLGGGAIPDIGDIGDITGGGASGKELALYENILMSRRCLEEAIIKFNLMDVYDQQYMHFALKLFRDDLMEISVDKIAGTMEIGIYDESPTRAKEITDYLIYQLNKINTELSVLSAKNNREFLGERYELVKKDLRMAEDSLKAFQQANGIAPDITVQAAVKTEIEIQAEIASEEVKLDLLKKILSSDQAEIKVQEEKIISLKNQLSQIQNSDGNSVLGLKGKPTVVMDFLRLKRDVEIQNKILGIILPLYEQAKIEENRETPSILIIDPPYIPDYKEKPKRAKGVLLVTLGTFVLVNIFVVAKYKWKQFKSENNFRQL